jgi:hypothetical protein
MHRCKVLPNGSNPKVFSQKGSGKNGSCYRLFFLVPITITNHYFRLVAFLMCDQSIHRPDAIFSLSNYQALTLKKSNGLLIDQIARLQLGT